MTCCEYESLSARRAWIEIQRRRDHHARPMSLSARRAWIEMENLFYKALQKKVALRKESVDRNHEYFVAMPAGASRSPQGERG